MAEKTFARVEIWDGMGVLDDVTLVNGVKSPLTLGKLPRKRTDEVQVFVTGKIEDADAQKLRAFTQRFKNVEICIHRCPTSSYTLQFLKHFPDLQTFSIQDPDFSDESELIHLPKILPKLNLGEPRGKGLSLKFLEKLTRLHYLGLCKHQKDIDTVGHLKSLRELMLRSITVPDLKFLLPLKGLQSLDIKLGGTNKLDLVPKIGRLRYLELWKINGLTDLSWLPQVKTLQYVWLQALGHVTSLPSLKPLRSLRRVLLETMHGIKDLAPIAEAPKLEDLVLADMRHLFPESLRPFIGLRTLRTVCINLGSNRKNKVVEGMLPYPDVEYPFHFQ
jgi:hypothetical protein